MRPVLALHADGREHRSAEIRDAIVEEFVITDDERRQMLPSGRTPLLNNRVHWAVTYLAQASALDRTRRGYTRITARGRDLLERYPDRIEAQALAEFREFADFTSRSAGRSRRGTATAGIHSGPPPRDQVQPVAPAPSVAQPLVGGSTPDEV